MAFQPVPMKSCTTRMSYRGPSGSVTLNLDVRNSSSAVCTTTGRYRCGAGGAPNFDGGWTKFHVS